MPEPEKQVPHQFETDEEDLTPEEEKVAGEYNLNEEELGMGDDYINSALAALENYEEPETPEPEPPGQSEPVVSPVSEDQALRIEEAEEAGIEQLRSRIVELDSALKAIRQKMQRQLDDLGKDLRESKRVIIHLRDECEELKTARDTMEKDAEEFKRKWQETASSYINYQKQMKKKMAEFVDMERSNLLRHFLPLIDNLARPLEYSGASGSIIDGVRLIHKQFEDFLGNQGVTAISAVGEKFDPFYHDAITRIPRDDLPSNTILEELQKGYMIGNKVLRPTRVSVSFSVTETDASAGGASESAGVQNVSQPEKLPDETEPDTHLIKDSNPSENSVRLPGNGITPDSGPVGQQLESNDTDWEDGSSESK